MSYASISKTLSDFTQKLIKLVEDGCDLQLHDHTDEDVAKHEQNVRNVTDNGTKDISNEAADAARERATFHLMSKGMLKADAEARADQAVKKVIDLAEKARQGASLTWTQMVGLITAIFVGASGYVYVHNKPARDAQQAALDSLRRVQDEQEQIQSLSAIVLSNDDFNMTTASLFVPSAPPPVTQNDQPIAAVPAPLPPPIAAVAAQPVEVEETNSAGEVTQQLTTTVEHAYRSLPRQAQQQMISSPPLKLDHDYDHENLNDCFHTDCLKGIDKQFHKDISITNGDGTATISVSVPR